MHFDGVRMHWNVNIHARHDWVYIVVCPDNTTFFILFSVFVKMKE